MTRRAAISLPDGLYRDVERDRKRRRLSRSAWLQGAARDFLRRHVRDEDIERYFDGYRRVPDNDEDFRAFARAGLEDLKKRRLA